ncbi:MAG: OadG family protein [Dehalococcoidales bacterium]|nr:OadG family protein [Dehalococcoidales bacterium]
MDVAFGVTMMVMGMGVTLITLYLLGVVITLMTRLFPHKAEEETKE